MIDFLFMLLVPFVAGLVVGALEMDWAWRKSGPGSHKHE